MRERERRHGGRRRTSFLAAIGILALLVAGSSAPAASAKKSRASTQMYAAFTKQNWPVVFQFSGDRRLLMRAAIVLDLSCQSGEVISGVGSGDRGLVVSASGAVKDSFDWGPIALPNGQTIQGHDDLSAKFNKKRTALKGTWRETMTINDPAAGTTDTCDSGSIAFSAVD